MVIMKKVLFQIAALLIALSVVVSCSEPLTFADTESPNIPQLKQSSAQFLWVGPEYRVVVQARLEDQEGISKLRLKNTEWQLDTTIVLNNQTSYDLNQTFIVGRDVNPTEHSVEITITNSKGGVVKANVAVEDLTAQNQVPGYNPDILPPVITVTKPTVTRFYGLTSDPVNVDIEAAISDASIASIEVRVWGETATGESVMQEQIITPATATEKQNYQFAKSFSLPAGKVGEYQYVVKSVDASGNKAVKGGSITVGYMDRLYLSDAENDAEVTNQGWDHMGGSRGIGTLLSMKKQGTNTFVADFYYRNEASDNIRFVAFIGSDVPFTGSSQATVNYSLNGPNVLGMSASQQGKITPVLSEANFKLPVSQKGYYHVTVDMTQRSVSVTPYTPVIPTDAVKFPGYSAANPWPYMAVTGPAVVGSSGAWSEVATSPKLSKEANHLYLYSGTFQTTNNSDNISLNAPWTANTDVWGKGWFRMTAGRSAMKDDYGSLITKVGPVGASSGGANWGFSLSPKGTFKATYDIALQRLRVVRTGN